MSKAKIDVPRSRLGKHYECSRPEKPFLPVEDEKVKDRLLVHHQESVNCPHNVYGSLLHGSRVRYCMALEIAELHDGETEGLLSVLALGTTGQIPLDSIGPYFL